MRSKHRPYKTYSKAFKLEAIRIMETPNRFVSEIAAELGIRNKKGQAIRNKNKNKKGQAD